MKFLVLGFFLTSLTAQAVQTNITLTPEAGQFDIRPEISLSTQSSYGDVKPGETGST